MNKAVKLRFWLEVGLGTVTSILFVVTLFWRDWIEIVFQIDPDNGSGVLEWLIVGILLVATIVLFALARLEWRNYKLSSQSQ